MPAAFIVIMSSNAYNSEWVQNEVSYAQGKRKAIFPILIGRRCLGFICGQTICGCKQWGNATKLIF